MKHKNWFWGIIFLAAGAVVIASQVNGFTVLGFWSIAAVVLLAAVLVSSVVYLNFFGIFVPAALLYAILEKPFKWPEISVWVLLFAAVLVSIGFSILFHRQIHRHCHHADYACSKHRESTKENVDGDDLFVNASFSDASKYLHADRLRQAHLTSSFGKLSVYFDNVKLDSAGAEVFVDVSFGKMDLYLPKDWRVEDRVETKGGTVSDHPRGTMQDENAPVLTLTGGVSFGSLEIQYV